MGHSHAHAHAEAEGTFFLDQLFTILVSGALGVVAILMYTTGTLQRILVPMFYAPVLIGGSTLIVMAAIRAIAVWQLAGARRVETEQCDHDHDHEHSHSHSHGHDHAHSHGEECGHDHAHSHSHAHAEGGEEHHDHGWAPWRYMVLAIPIFLYFLGFPRDGLGNRIVDRNTSQSLQASPKREALSMFVGGVAFTKVLRKPDPKRMELKFKELTEAAAIPRLQEIYEGDIGVLRGQYIPLRSSDREFTLLRVNMTCCVADQVFLEMRIVAPEPITGIAPQQWIRVAGLISFQKNEKGKWIPVLTLANNDAIDPNAEPTTDANIP
ncbi:MAG: hypothetical protein J2P46_12905 [Zavarzinella sp.]|nr:hypothetical protein [Zavarzinella sp.]